MEYREMKENSTFLSPNPPYWTIIITTYIQLCNNTTPTSGVGYNVLKYNSVFSTKCFKDYSLKQLKIRNTSLCLLLDSNNTTTTTKICFDFINSWIFFLLLWDSFLLLGFSFKWLCILKVGLNWFAWERVCG